MPYEILIGCFIPYHPIGWSSWGATASGRLVPSGTCSAVLAVDSVARAGLPPSLIRGGQQDCCRSGRYPRPMDQQHLANLAHLRRARDLVDREYARPLDVPTMA